MDIPPEILFKIAAQLNAQDLGQFRLANRYFSRVAGPLIARNGLSLLNISEEIKRLEQIFEDANIAQSARKLTISYGNWPVCTRQEWELHPLLFGGQARFQSFRTSRADRAFQEYSAFIKDEKDRTHQKDLDATFRVLSLLPNLHTIVIAQMHWYPSRNTRYRSLQQKIWMTPYTNDPIAPAVQTFLLTFTHRFPNVSCFEIHGAFVPTELCHTGMKFFYIRKLYISSLQVQRNEDVTRIFLQAFPNLTDLSIKFKGWDQAIPNVTSSLVFSSLRNTSFDNLWASEEQILIFFKDHQETLEIFSLGNTTIIHGSWRSLFTRIRNLNARAQIKINGELYGRTSKDTLSLNPITIILLTDFLLDRNLTWPFI
jgi:hypothetical protein